MTGQTTTTAPKKKSLFRRQLEEAEEPENESIDSVDFFARSKALFPKVIAEEQKRHEKKQAKNERKRSSTSRERSELSPRGGKRKCILTQQESADSSEDSHLDQTDSPAYKRRESTLSTPGSRRSQSTTSRRIQISPKKASPVKTQATKAGVDAKSCIVLTDNESESGDDAEPIKLIDLQPEPLSLNASDDEDEELAQLVETARLRRERAEQERKNSSTSFSNKNHESGKETLPALEDVFGSNSKIEQDPTIFIFVTSRILGTKSMIFKRKLSQRLHEVRRNWCDRQVIDGQPMDADLASEIFLTWKGKRLFDSTTCNSMGLKIDSKGQLHSEGKGFDNGKVHLEAWTHELFADHQKREAAEALQKRKAAEEPEQIEEVKQQPKIKLILISREHEPVKLVVKSSITIARLVSEFRSQNGISADKHIVLQFDGDDLAEDTTVAEADLVDMDTVDVFVR